MVLNIENRMSHSAPRFALWQLGFRPFFLLAGLSAVLLMLYWLLIYFGQLPTPYYSNPAFWHSHELLFGYTTAVIAGFLLTAVKNWTGRQTLQGVPLMLLTLLWLAGRLAIGLAAFIPQPVVMLIDVAFLPVLGVAVAIPLLQVRQYPNLLIFTAVLVLMTVANVQSHLEPTTIHPLPGSGIQLMLYLIMLLIAIMAGRVVPFFTERGLGGVKLTIYPWLERMAILSIVLYALAAWLPLNEITRLALAAVALVLNGARWFSWQHPGLWRVPMLWVLHLAYAWLVLSLLFGVLAQLGMVSPVVEVHAFTVGTLGMITLGMMARVSLGHSGREISASPLTTLAFVCLFLAALIRVGGALIGGDSYAFSIAASATFWLLAFGLFVIEYIPVLINPRIDGRPG